MWKHMNAPSLRTRLSSDLPHRGGRQYCKSICNATKRIKNLCGTMHVRVGDLVLHLEYEKQTIVVSTII
ncbi:MAG: hypothetical protein AAB296_07860, partial [Candidatus Desantisbacteria bacterium]